MPTYKITETQLVTYSWVRETPDIETALATADDGVPDDARSSLRNSDTYAVEIGPDRC